MVDQTEAALKAQLDQVGKTRKQLQELMVELDDRLGDKTAPLQPATPAKGPAKPAPRPPRRRRVIT